MTGGKRQRHRHQSNDAGAGPCRMNDGNGGNVDRRGRGKEEHEPKLPGRKFMTYSGWTRSPKGKPTTEDKVENLTF